MKTLETRYTRGDAMTRPGGIVLRLRDEAPRYIVHSFHREPGSNEPTGFFWGSYHENYWDAWDAFQDKCKRARRYDAGGSLIAPHAEFAELTRELNPAEG